MNRATVMQQKTHQPVKFEITEETHEAVEALITKAKLRAGDYIFPSRAKASPHLTTRQYALIVHQWIEGLRLAPANYGTHFLRRTKASLIYQRVKTKGCAAALRTYQTREHGKIPRC